MRLSTTLALALFAATAAPLSAGEVNDEPISVVQDVVWNPVAETKEQNKPSQLPVAAERAVAANIADVLSPSLKAVPDYRNGNVSIYRMQYPEAQSQSSRTLYIHDFVNGYFVSPQMVFGESGTSYSVPQSITTTAFFDAEHGIAQCGFAVLEPMLKDYALQFGNVRSLKLGEDLAFASLCGSVVQAQDVYGGTAEQLGDGIDELVTEVFIVDRRTDTENTQLSKIRYVVDVSTGVAVVLQQSAPEAVETDLEDLLLGVELLERGKVQIRTNYHAPETRAFPPELSGLKAKYPVLVVDWVQREGDLTKVRFTLSDVVPSRIAKEIFLLGLKPSKDGFWVDAETDALGKKHVTYCYTPAPPKSEPAQP